MSAGERPNSTRLQRMARAYAESAVLYAALDLDLFTHVARGAATAAALAAALGITALNAERLVTACLAMGLLTEAGGRLANAPDAARFLVRDAPDFAGPWMNFTRPQVPEWFRLAEHLRSTAPPRTLGNYDRLTVAQARAYHEATFSIGMGAGRRFARHVNLAGRRRLLDLGGGSGAYSIAATRAYPGLRAVVFDLPPVVVVTRETVAAQDAGGSVEAMAGDFTRDAFPTDCDVVVMASNLPLYDETAIAAVVRRVHQALLPGGELHLVGEMLDDDRRGPLDAALWGIAEAIEGSGGKAHTVGQVRDYFSAAGFLDVAEHPFVPGTLTRVSGRKAG
jgi:SAM-dependent methyltransferase